MITNLNLCKHRWTTINKSHFDRLNWITIEKCRKCPEINQVEWNVKRESGRIETTCTRTVVHPTQVDNKTGEIQ